MFDEDEIKSQLQGISQDKCVALAVRSAMRVLPVLAVQEKTNTDHDRNAFWFWKEKERSDNLFKVLNGYRNTISSCLANSYTDATYKYIQQALPFGFTATAPYAVIDAAVYAADTASKDAQDWICYPSNVACTLRSAAKAFATADIILFEFQDDLTKLKTITTEALLQRPLWTTRLPENWHQLITDFIIYVLSLNADFEVWLDWYEDRLQGEPIDNKSFRSWNNIPKEIQQQGAAVINAYLKNFVQKKTAQPLNRVRAIFLGYGEAGKTSLVRALHNEPVPEGKEPMTPGIEIRDWAIPDSNIKAHFWDFGGQVMAHATHQFFLRSSCLYVLVLNARNEINGTEQAEYWLEHVKSFGDNAPVMIVCNKADQTRVNLDMSYLKTKYPNIVDDYPLSCTKASTLYKAEFDRFHRDFCAALQQVGTHQMLFTKEQFAVLEALRQYSPETSFLKHAEFELLCEQHGIEKEGVLNREWLLDILDKLGVVIHFPNLAFLDEYILNPRWLTFGVYTLMYARQERINETQIHRFLNIQDVSDELGSTLVYPKDKCRVIMEAMKEFKLCYSLPGDSKTLIIPELLPTDQPEIIPFAKSGSLAFEFKFWGFLPRHVMPELIVNRHEEIVEPFVWQRGVVLAHKNIQAKALLQVDYHERVLSIWVEGRDAKDYLGLLIDEVLKILGRLVKLKFDEWITLPLSACVSPNSLGRKEEKALYQQVLAFAREGEQFYISASGLKYDLTQVLPMILSAAGQMKAGITNHFYGSSHAVNQTGEQKMVNQNVNINNSNVGGSVVAAEKIENSFNSLQKSKANDEVKILLEQLLAEIKNLNDKVPTQQLADMLEGAETLITETARESPRKKWYEASLEGIKEAALAVGVIARPVLDIAEKLTPLLN